MSVLNNTFCIPDVNPCQNCGDPILPTAYLQSKERAAARRYCSTTCAGLARKTGSIVCGLCGSQMRPYGTLAGDFPGLVERRSRSICGPCAKSGTFRGTVSIESTISGLVAFLMDRRGRGVPVEGVLMDGEKPNSSLDQLISY